METEAQTATENGEIDISGLDISEVLQGYGDSVRDSESKDYVTAEELETLRKGVTPQEAKVSGEPPKAWLKGLKGYFPNDGSVVEIDPTRTVPPYVVLLDNSHPVAKLWITPKVVMSSIYSLRCSGMAPDKIDVSFTTTDSCLTASMGQKLTDITSELTNRLEELKSAGLVKRCEVTSSGACGAKPCAEILAILQAYGFFSLDRRLFYGDDNIRLKCIPRGSIPSMEKLTETYLKFHEGCGGSVAVSVNFWNRCCSLATRKQIEASSTKNDNTSDSIKQ